MIPSRFYLKNQSFGHTSTTELIQKGIFRKSCIRRKPLLSKTYDIKLPSEKQWRTFRESLNTCLAFKWEKEYVNYEVLDGMHWEIEIEFSDGRGIHSIGCNAYPVATQWDTFNSAISKLLGINWIDYKK